MRILVVTLFIDRSEAALYKGLVRRGMELDVVCRPDAPRRAMLLDAGLPVTTLQTRHRLDLGAVRFLRKRIAERKYDLVYAPANSTLSVSLMACHGTRVRRVGYRGTMGHLSRWDPAAWLTYLNPAVDRIVCVSNAVRRYLLGMGIPPARLATIYKGHDPAWYAGGPDPCRAEFGLPEDAFVVGFIGTVRPVKGVDVLLRAICALPESANVHLLVVGDVLDARVKRMARTPRLRAITHFAGYHTDGFRVARLCNAVAMPSVAREGLPRTLIEAMAQGIPVIASDVGGIPELVVHEQTGLVVPPRDHAALTAALAALAGNRQQARAYGEQARIRIEQAFHIETTIHSMSRLFEDCVKGAGASPKTGDQASSPAAT